MHTGSVDKVPDAEMAEYLKARLAGITIPKEISGVSRGGEPITYDNPEYQEKVAYETARAQAGWAAECSCGWTGNNPYAAEADAKEGISEHYASVENALKGLGG